MFQAIENTLPEKYRPVIGQFLRFAVIGLINFAIDSIILNLLSKLTGIHSGNRLIPLNLISFSIATTNSYILNKRWAFHDVSHAHPTRKWSLFLAVSLIGAVINTSVVRLVTTNISPMFGMSPQLWLNVAKIAATGVSLIWNFIGYRVFVFKSK